MTPLRININGRILKGENSELVEVTEDLFIDHTGIWFLQPETMRWKMVVCPLLIISIPPMFFVSTPQIRFELKQMMQGFG